ncbi:MAG: amino acid dehydrogenase [Gammaproteobacteria bacterium]|nr:amino acid dehydrogenase [Gammaproteobacteria bacterium]
MKELLQEYENKTPEIVFEWHDSETDAVGWVVINSLRNGAAGGGTRMRAGLNKDEVVSLAKTMEIKFTVSGPAIGGAKSGINFDPKDPRKREVLTRWYRAVAPLLKNYYGTGGDLNVDALLDVIPLTEKYGIWHPMEGVINGHINPKEAEKIQLIGQLRAGVAKIMEDPRYAPEGGRTYKVADMITGYGVAESVRHTYACYGENLEGKRVIVQGWGNVAAAAATYLAKEGARIVGIIDRVGGLIDADGMDLETTKALFFNRDGNALNAPDMLSFDEVNQRIWETPAEIFIPCAASRLVTRAQVDSMVNCGLELIACGANVAFADEQIFYGPIAEYADSKVAVVADFIANCGMARVFAYLMQSGVEVTDEAIFSDVSNTIGEVVRRVCAERPDRRQLMATALGQSIKELI